MGGGVNVTATRAATRAFRAEFQASSKPQVVPLHLSRLGCTNMISPHMPISMNSMA